MAGLAAVGGIVSGVAGGMGSMMGAAGEASALRTQANVKAAEGQAQRRKGIEEQGRATYKAREEQKQTDKTLSDQRARFASAGGGIDGSARETSELTGERGLDRSNTTIWQGLQANQSRQFQADILQVEADPLRQAASTKQKAGAIAGISSMVGGFGGAIKGGGGIGGGSSGGNYVFGS